MVARSCCGNQLRRSKKVVSVRGLNKNHNHDLKSLFQSTATMASVRPGPFRESSKGRPFIMR